MTITVGGPDVSTGSVPAIMSTNSAPAIMSTNSAPTSMSTNLEGASIRTSLQSLRADHAILHKDTTKLVLEKSEKVTELAKTLLIPKVLQYFTQVYKKNNDIMVDLSFINNEGIPMKATINATQGLLVSSSKGIENYVMILKDRTNTNGTSELRIPDAIKKSVMSFGENYNNLLEQAPPHINTASKISALWGKSLRVPLPQDKLNNNLAHCITRSVRSDNQKSNEKVQKLLNVADAYRINRGEIVSVCCRLCLEEDDIESAYFFATNV